MDVQLLSKSATTLKHKWPTVIPRVMGMGEDNEMTTQCGNSPVVEKKDCQCATIISEIRGHCDPKFDNTNNMEVQEISLPMEMGPRLGLGGGEDLNKLL